MAEETPQESFMVFPAEDVNVWVADVVAALQERLIAEGWRTQPSQPVDHPSLAVLTAYLFSLVSPADNALPMQRMTPYYRIFCNIGWDPRQLSPLWNHVAQVLIQQRLASEPAQDILPTLQRLLEDANALHMLANHNVCATEGAPVLKKTLDSDMHTVLPIEEPMLRPHPTALQDPTPGAPCNAGQRVATHLDPPDPAVSSPDAMIAEWGSRIERALGQLLLRRTRVHLYESLVARLPGVDVTIYPLLSGIGRLGRSSITQLAHEVGLDRSGASRYAARLEAAGLITRVNNTADTRAVDLALTPHGQAVVEEMRRRLAHYLGHQLQAWPSGEATQFVPAFERFVADLTAVP